MQNKEADIKLLKERIGTAKKSKTPLLSLWPLLLFSLLVPLLVSAYYAAYSKGVFFNAYLFLGIALVVVLMSFAQKGKNAQWQTIVNLRKSWFSREIIAFGLFVPFASVWLFYPRQIELGLLAAIAGLFSLVSIDNLYRQLLVKKQNKYHSADVLFFTTFLYVALFVGNPYLFMAAIVLKAYLYVSRKQMYHRQGKNIRLNLSIARVLLGFLLPVVLFFVPDLDFFGYTAFVLLVLGEIIDRSEFYIELVTLDS